MNYVLYNEINPQQLTIMPLPNCLEPPYQNEARCTTFHVKMSYMCKWMETLFHVEGCALDLAFLETLKAIQKWPIYTASSPFPG